MISILTNKLLIISLNILICILIYPLSVVESNNQCSLKAVIFGFCFTVASLVSDRPPPSH